MGTEMGTGMDLSCAGLCHRDVTTGVGVVRDTPQNTQRDPRAAKSWEKAVYRVSGPGGKGAGVTVRVPLQLVTGGEVAG